LARRKTHTNKRNHALNKPLQFKLSKQYPAQLPTHLGIQHPRILIMESPTSQGLPTQYYPYLPQDIPDPESNPFPTEWQPSQDLDSDLVLLTMDPSSTQFQGDFSLDLLSYISPTHLYTSDSDPLARYENNLTHFAESFFEYDHNLNVLEEPNSVIGPWHPTDMGSAIQPESVVVPTSSEHSSTIPEASERATTMDSVENSDQITYSCTFAGCQRTFCKRCLLKYAHAPSFVLLSCESSKSG